MELVEQVNEVVDGVIENLSDTFGSDAYKFICPDDITDKAQVQLQTSCSVQEAVQHISSALQWNIRKEMDKKNNITEKTTSDLEKTSEELILSQWCTMPPTTQEEVPGVESQASSQPELSSVGETSNSVVSLTSTTTTSSDKQLLDDHKDISSGEDDDVVLVTPPPKEPDPVIVLTDDSCESTSSATNNGCESIINLTKSQKECTEPDMNPKDLALVFGLFEDIAAHMQRSKAEQEIVLDDANKSLANLRKDEVTLNERINEIKREEKRCIDNIDSVSESSSSVGTEEDEGASRSASSHSSDNVNLQPLSFQPTEVNLNACTDENKNSTNKADVVNFLTSNQPGGSQPDELWEDAHFVCSLLPYFTLEDVHKTMVDNLHHPDRRAYVLEAYINLAVDRQEPVQDAVFQGLWAARKRSHGEPTDSSVKSNIKKRKIEPEPEADVKVQRDDEGVPSTSSAGNTSVRVSEPGISTDVGTTDISGSKLRDHLLEKWYKEKMDFVCAVVQIVDRKLLWDQILLCQTEADVEALMERMMEEQDQAAVHSPVTAPFYPGQDQPSTSAFQPVAAAAGPSHALERRDEPLPGQSSEEAATGEEDQGGQAADVEEKILAQVKTLSEMFADADPDYLQERYAHKSHVF